MACTGRAYGSLPYWIPPETMQKTRTFDRSNWMARFGNRSKWSLPAIQFSGTAYIQAYDAATLSHSAANLRNFYRQPQNAHLLEEWARDPLKHYKLRVLDQAYRVGGGTSADTSREKRWQELHDLVVKLPPVATGTSEATQPSGEEAASGEDLETEAAAGVTQPPGKRQRTEPHGSSMAAGPGSGDDNAGDELADGHEEHQAEHAPPEAGPVGHTGAEAALHVI